MDENNKAENTHQIDRWVDFNGMWTRLGLFFQEFRDWI